jgi:V/A-type H+-transporting ATPase subunit I
MARVRVLALESNLDAVLAELQRLGLFEVARRSSEDGPVLGPSAHAAARAAQEEGDRLLLARIEGLLGLAPVPDVPAAIPEQEEASLLAAVAEEVGRLAPDLEAAARRRDACRSERTTLPRHLASIRRMLPFLPEPGALRGYETVFLWLDARHEGVLEDLRAHLEAISGRRHALIAAHLDADAIGALAIVPREGAAALLGLLGGLPVARMRLPENYQGLPLPEAVAAMERHVEALAAEEAALDARIAGALAPLRAPWSAAAQAVRRRIARLRAAAAAASTGSVAVLEGWVPVRDLPTLRRVLAGAGAQAELEKIPAPSGTEPPVLLDNPPPVRPFEMLVRLFGLPRAGGIDPTPWLAAGFPLFIGLMVGDAGHGLCLAGIALALRGRGGSRPSWARDLGAAMLAAAVSAIVFGLVFGEFFGGLGRPPGFVPLVDRERATVALLYAAVGLGIVHVTLGHVIGVHAALRRRAGRPVLEHAGRVFLVAGAGTAAASRAHVLPESVGQAGLAFVVAGLGAIALGAGRKSVVEAPMACLESAGRVLSYLRLAAIGIASVHLSAVASRLANVLSPEIGIPAAVALHVLNVALAAFTPTVQALRLHYVEFFSGFHEGGGTPFAPLSSAEPTR